MAAKVDVRYVSFYTTGSAAKKIVPVMPLKTIKLPRLRKIKPVVLRIDPVAFAGIAMSAILFVLLTVGIFQLQSARQETARLAAYVDTLQVENETLRSEYEAGYDLETVEKTALALGMIPVEEAQRVSIQVQDIETPAKTGVWEGFFTFLAGLFA